MQTVPGAFMHLRQGSAILLSLRAMHEAKVFIQNTHVWLTGWHCCRRKGTIPRYAYRMEFTGSLKAAGITSMMPSWIAECCAMLLVSQLCQCSFYMYPCMCKLPMHGHLSAA